jgi:type I restriction enzyme, R subunit
MSQFAFLKDEFPDIFAHAARAENFAHSDPRAAAFYGRLALETAVYWLFRHDRTLKDPFEPTLAAHLAEPTFRALVGQTLAAKARFVKDTGNAAAHGKSVSADRRPPACANSSMLPTGSRAPTRAARSRRPTPPSASRRCRDWRR